MSLPIGTRLGAFEILAPIGAGGMGEVYRAADGRLDRIVALKVLHAELAADPARRERFEREARAISSLTHPHICTLFDVGREGDIEFLVMEYVEGDTLEQRLLSGPLSIDQSLRHAAEISDALDHAHRRGIVHRDLKPSNIMLTKSGVKLLDFGLAKTGIADPMTTASQMPATATGTLTSQGTILGTLHYMAPEQLEADVVDGRADIFALGAVIHEMVTGRRTFDGGSRASVIASILRGEPAPLTAVQPSISPALDRAVRKCLEKDPDNRWQTARDLTSELAWIRESGLRAQLSQPAPERLTSAGRRAWIAAGVLVALAAIAALWTIPARSHSTIKESAPVTQARRFAIAAPEGSSSVECVNCIAVSPDGLKVVFGAGVPGGTLQLWLQHLDLATARALPGTNDAHNPFWFPDSRAIGFVANDRLRKLDINTGNLQTLGDAEPHNVQGATVSSDGTVLFSERTTGLSRILAGGHVVPVTRLDRQREEVAHSWPQFLPDGRHFLYRIKSERPENTGIFLGLLDSAETRTLVLNVDANPVQAGPGYLVYGTNNTLLARPFDLSTFHAGEPPVMLAQQVVFSSVSGRSAFSATDSVLAYRQTEPTELRWFDRQGNALQAVGPPGRYLDPTLSPNQQQVAVAHIEADLGTSHITLINLATGNETPLTSGRFWDQSPVWSPDGNFVAFSSNRSEFFEIYQKAASGLTAEERPLSHRGAPTAWSPEGFIVYQAILGSNSGGTWTVDSPPADGPVPKLSGTQAQLSPNGETIAYVSNETGQNEIYIRPVRSGQHATKVSDQGGVEPRWRGNGKELFYLAPTGRSLMTVDITGSGQVKAGVPHALFTTQLQATTAFLVGRIEYDVSADGQRFLMNVPARQTSSPITVVVDWKALMHR